MLDYNVHAQSNSLYNTPSVFAIYIVRLVAKWMLELDRGDRRRDVIHGVTLPKSATGVDVARDIATKDLGGFSCAFQKIKIGPGS